MVWQERQWQGRSQTLHGFSWDMKDRPLAIAPATTSRVSQGVKAPGSYPGDRGFNSLTRYQFFESVAVQNYLKHPPKCLVGIRLHAKGIPDDLGNKTPTATLPTRNPPHY